MNNAAFHLHYIENDVVEVDKPYGLSSAEIVRYFKYTEKIKVGHAGTLDPLATGSLIILFGKGTKKSNKYLEKQKTYSFKFVLGMQSISNDLEDSININGIHAGAGTRQMQKIVTKYLENLKDNGYEQKVSAKSAVKIAGKELYKINDINEELLPQRNVILHDYKIEITEITKTELISVLIENIKKLDETQNIEERLQFKFSNRQSAVFAQCKAGITFAINEVEKNVLEKYYLVDMMATVSKGTYVRVLAKDIAALFNTGAVVVELRRELQS